MEKTVLVVIPAEERHKEKLERAGKGCRFVYASPQTATEEMIEAADVIIVFCQALFPKKSVRIPCF